MKSIVGRLKAFKYGIVANLTDDKELASKVRGQQVAAIMRATPAMLLAMTINIAATLFVFGNVEDPTKLYIWAGAAALLVLFGTFGHLAHFGKEIIARPVKTISKPFKNAFAMGLVWAAAPLLLYPDASSEQRIFLTCIAAGMMGGGVMALSTMPLIANTMLTLIGVASFITLLLVNEPIYFVCAAVLVNYGVALWFTANRQGKMYVEACLDEHQVSKSAETISLLLRDFEDNSGDWIWEINAYGKFRNPSDRFCEVSGRSKEDLESIDLFDMIGPVPEDERRRSNIIDISNLRELFDKGRELREIVVCISTPYGRKWWMFSGHAVSNEKGEPNGYKGVCSDISERKEAEMQLAQMARQDFLTGLYNRPEFERLLNRRLEEARGRGDYFGILYLDLDKFKNINDTLGHSIGDKLLIEAAKRIQQVIGPEGIAARLGGDEFAVVCKAANGLKDAEIQCENLIGSIARPFEIDGHRLSISTSIGLAIADSASKSAEHLIHASDLALYRAKADGRGGYKLYAEHMDAALRERRAMEGELRSAVVNNELELHYQPLADIETGRVLGFEALLRWNNPRRGQVQPLKFIPLAEETGLINEIGEWVIAKACEDAKTWPAHMKVSVNLSGKQLASYRIVQCVIQALGDSGLAPQRLELEVTESVLINDPEKTLELLTNLRELGVSIALDDFGTGYSSLSYLVRFPFDKLKIDKSFVQSASESPENLAIVRSILKLAGYLKITTLAEGIETREHIELLRSEGCEQVQGFLLDKPQPHDELQQFARYPIGHDEVGSTETNAKIMQMKERLDQLNRKKSVS